MDLLKFLGYLNTERRMTMILEVSNASMALLLEWDIKSPGNNWNPN